MNNKSKIEDYRGMIQKKLNRFWQLDMIWMVVGLLIIIAIPVMLVVGPGINKLVCAVTLSAIYFIVAFFIFKPIKDGVEFKIKSVIDEIISLKEADDEKYSFEFRFGPTPSEMVSDKYVDDINRIFDGVLKNIIVDAHSCMDGKPKYPIYLRILVEV